MIALVTGSAPLAVLRQCSECAEEARLDALLDFVARGSRGSRAKEQPAEPDWRPLRDALRRHERLASHSLGDDLPPAMTRHSPDLLLSLVLLRDLVSTGVQRSLGRLSPADRGILSGAVHEIAQGYTDRNPVSMRLATFAAIDLFTQRTSSDPHSALLLAYRFSLEADLRHSWPDRAHPSTALAALRTLELAIVRGQNNLAARSIHTLFQAAFPDIPSLSATWLGKGAPP